MNVVRARAWTQRRACGLEVLLVGLEHPPRLGTGRCPAGRDRPRNLDPVSAGSRDLERRQDEIALADPSLLARDPELRLRLAVVADEHHVHGLAAAALVDEIVLARAEQLRLGAAHREGVEKDPEALRIDPDAVADRGQLLVALDRPREVELDVVGDELEVAARQGAVVANRHHVLEPGDPHALPAPVAGAIAEPRATRADPDLLGDPRRPVLANVARSDREDCR